MKIILKESERDQIISKLSSDQQQFLISHVKRGKRSMFANEMAKAKGISITETMTNDEIERLLEEWILIDYIDAGKVSNNLRCQCGRALRYQYVVKNLKNGDILRFGRDHFQEHTKLSPSIVKSVLKGLEEIDYERDEILYKVAHGWRLEQEFSYYISRITALNKNPTPIIADSNGSNTLSKWMLCSEDIQIPDYLHHHLESGLPLLEWQVKKLHKLVQDFFEESINLQKKLVTKRDSSENLIRKLSAFEEREENQIDLFNQSIHQQVDLFSFQTQGEITNASRKNSFITSADFSGASAICLYLKEGIESARVICELLIRHEGMNEERYATGKPKIYLDVCRYIDRLVEQGEYQLIQSNQQDRQYRKSIN